MLPIDKIIREVAEDVGIPVMVVERCYLDQWRFVGNEVNGSTIMNINNIRVPSFGFFWVKKYNLIRGHKRSKKIMEYVIAKRNRGLPGGQYTVSIKSDSVDIPK